MSGRESLLARLQETELRRLPAERARREEVADAGDAVDAVEARPRVDQIVVRGRRLELPAQAVVERDVGPELPGVLPVERPLVLVVVLIEGMEAVLLRVAVERGRAVNRTHAPGQVCVEGARVRELCGVRSGERLARAGVCEHAGRARVDGVARGDAEHELRDDLRARGGG